MVLNGIGGATIAEAKANLTPEEADLWTHYINRHGSINIGRRLESGFALLAVLLTGLGGKQAVMKDFMPHYRESGITIEEALKTWR